MKKLLLLLFMAVSIFAVGGDTLEYDAGVLGVKDGDTMYVNIWYHPFKDSVQSVVNGRLGDDNLAADANIQLSKLDTSSTMTKLKVDTITSNPYIDSAVISYLNVDTIRGYPDIDSVGGDVRFTGSLSVNGDLGVDSITVVNGISVNGDLLKANTSTGAVTITGPADDTEVFNITTNSKELISCSGTELAINADGYDIDFRVEGESISDVLHIDAANDVVNIKGGVGGSALVVYTFATEVFRCLTGEVVVNETSTDVDFRVEGDTNASLFKTHAVGDSVTVDGGFSASNIKTDSIRLSSGTWLKTYEEGKFYATYLGFSGTVQDTIRYTVVGNVVTLQFDAMSATSNATTFQVDTVGVPAILYPLTNYSSASGWSADDNNGSFFGFGAWIVHDSDVFIGFYLLGAGGQYGDWTGSNSKGFSNGATITYRK